MPWSCNRVAVDERDSEGKPLSYKITRQLPKDFLPYIAIADKGPVPDKVEAYVSNKAYTAKAARIKFNGITLSVAPVGSKETSEDDFDWFLSGGGNGPFYLSFVARKTEMLPELKNLIDENAHRFDQPESLMSRRAFDERKEDVMWFRMFFHKIFPIGQGRKGIMHESLFPELYWSNAELGNSAANSVFDRRTQSLRMTEDTDFSKAKINLVMDDDYAGIKLLYRMPYEYFPNSTTIYDRMNVDYNFGMGGIYHHHAGQRGVHYMYNPFDKNIYRLNNYGHYTNKVTGLFVGKYNY